MEWYYHALLYPHAFAVNLPSYVWKTIVGVKDFLVEVQSTKEKLALKYESSVRFESESDSGESTDDE